MSVSFIQYKGKKILYTDFSNCKTAQETIDILEQTRKVYLTSDEMYLALNNFSNAPSNTEFIELAKKYAVEIFDKRNIREACFGLSGVKNILLWAYNLVVKDKIISFETKEQALEYLVKE
jgi:hypothetical protein